MIFAWSVLAATMLVSAPSSGAPAATKTIPTVYEVGHFYAVPKTRGGQKLRLLVDTGGGGTSGLYWITAAAAERLHLKTRTCTTGKQHLPVANLPDYEQGHALPPPLDNPCGAVLLVNKEPAHGVDGQLGAGYLPGRVWTFDYPAHRLSLEGKSWHPDVSAHAAALGFPHDAKGRLTSGFARITLHVDGRPLPMLLDTGATAHPTPVGEKASGTPTVNGYGVTSYITTAMLERWHKAHPEWRVVDEGGDIFGPGHAMRLIEGRKWRSPAGPWVRYGSPSVPMQRSTE